MRRVRLAGLAVAVALVLVAVLFLTRSKPLDPRIAAAYVQAQARALCIVQSKSFRTQAALEQAYRKTQSASTLTAEELARARSAAEKDVELRRRVSARVAALCG